MGSDQGRLNNVCRRSYSTKSSVRRAYNSATFSGSLAEELVAEIVEAASGVFLWVRLVVGSLLRGFQNHDTIHDLQRRLRELPHDLENLFMHMLNLVPLFYKVQSLQLFQVVQASREMDTSHMAFQPPNLTAIGLLLAQEDTAFVLNFSCSPLSENKAKARVQETEACLKTCCAGLLELQHWSRDGESDKESEDIQNLLEKPVEQIGSGK